MRTGTLLRLQRLAGNAAVNRLLKGPMVVQRVGGENGTAVVHESEGHESEDEESESKGNEQQHEHDELAGLREALGVDEQTARTLLPLQAQFGLPAMRILHDHLGDAAKEVWRSRSRARTLLRFVQRMGSGNDAYAAAGDALAAAHGDRFLGSRILSLVERRWTERAALIKIAGSLETADAHEALNLITRGNTKLEVLKTLALRPEHIPDVWSVVKSSGADPLTFEPAVTLLDAVAFSRDVVALLVSLGPKAADLATWVTKVSTGTADRVSSICLLLVHHKDHIAEVRRVVDHTGGKPDLAAPVLELLEVCTYRPEVVNCFIAFDPPAAAETSTWATRASGREPARLNAIVALVIRHPGHVSEVRQVVDHVGNDADLATPILDFAAGCAYEGDVLGFALSLGPAAAAHTCQWATGVAGRDAGRALKLVDLLRAHPGHAQHVKDAVEGTANLDSAGQRLKQLAQFGYSPELMATASTLGEEHAQAAHRARMTPLRSELTAPSKKQLKKAGNVLSKTVVELGKTKGKEKGPATADLDLISSASPEFKRLQEEKQKSYVTERETADKEKPGQASAFTSGLAGVASWALPSVTPPRLEELFKSTKDDPARAEPIAKVLQLAGTDGEALATKLLSEPIAVAHACVALITAGAPPAGVLNAAKLRAAYPDTEVRDWLEKAAQHGLDEVVAFLSKFSGAMVVTAAIVGRAFDRDTRAEDLCATKTVKTAGKADVLWLVGQRGDAGFKSFCDLIRSKEPALNKLHQLADTASGKSMGLISLPTWFVASTTIDQMIMAINTTPAQCLGCPTFVRLCLVFGAQPGSEMLLIAAQAEARLADLNDSSVVEHKRADIAYKGGLGKYAKGRSDPRTGFLTAPGAGWELHTHWYTSEAKLTSMHVKQANVAAGAKGIELNQYSTYFPRLMQRAVDLHGLGGVALQETS